MFNVTGGEVMIILVIALVVLGPEKLPDMIRKAGRLYGEVRRMANGFQSEIRDAFDEPTRELRETAEMARNAMTGAASDITSAVQSTFRDDRPAVRADPMVPVVLEREPELAAPVANGVVAPAADATATDAAAADATAAQPGPFDGKATSFGPSKAEPVVSTNGSAPALVVAAPVPSAPPGRSAAAATLPMPLPPPPPERLNQAPVARPLAPPLPPPVSTNGDH